MTDEDIARAIARDLQKDLDKTYLEQITETLEMFSPPYLNYEFDGLVHLSAVGWSGRVSRCGVMFANGWVYVGPERLLTCLRGLDG